MGVETTLLYKVLCHLSTACRFPPSPRGGGVQQLTPWQMRREVMDLPAYSNGGSAVRMAWASSGWPSAYGQALNPDVRDAAAFAGREAVAVVRVIPTDEACVRNVFQQAQPQRVHLLFQGGGMKA
jgi:hypothetical protein